MVIDPATADWSLFSDYVVLLLATDGIPEAVDELRRRATAVDA